MGLGGFLFSKNHRDRFTSGRESQDLVHSQELCCHKPII